MARNLLDIGFQNYVAHVSHVTFITAQYWNCVSTFQTPAVVSGTYRRDQVSKLVEELCNEHTLAKTDYVCLPGEHKYPFRDS